MRPVVLCAMSLLVVVSQPGYAQSIRIHTHQGITELNVADIDSITFVTSADDSGLAAGLALRMPFQGTLDDSSGNGNNGSCPNPSYAVDRFGAPSSAYKFNGVNNYITVPNSPSLNPADALTIAFWIKIDTVAWNVSQLVSKTDNDVGSQREYLVELKANFDYPYFKLWGAIPGGGVKELYGGAALIHQWHHVAGVIDRKTTHSMKLYIDGAQVETLDDPAGGFVANSHPLYIGAGEGSWESTSVPDCMMDDLRIYTRALSAAEVLTLYNKH